MNTPCQHPHEAPPSTKPDENPSIICHLSIGTNQFEDAARFYDQCLTVLGAKRIMEHPGAIGYGKLYPEFWIQTPGDGKAANCANGAHISFLADSPEHVDRFYHTAIAAGGQCDGEPGPRTDYGPAYYGCFLRDLDGHKIEATFWDVSLDPL